MCTYVLCILCDPFLSRESLKHTPSHFTLLSLRLDDIEKGCRRGWLLVRGCHTKVKDWSRRASLLHLLRLPGNRRWALLASLLASYKTRLSFYL